MPKKPPTRRTLIYQDSALAQARSQPQILRAREFWGKNRGAKDKYFGAADYVTIYIVN